jgi:hypothetical protein
MDKAPMGMLTYFRDYGAKVSKIYKNIQDAEQDFVMQVGHVRLIIVDSGTGVFASTRSRAKLASLAGAIDDEKKITIFYSDSLIKYDIVNQTQYDGGINFEKDIEWFKYKSTPDLLARILKMNKKQNFTYSHNKDDEHFENVHKKNKDGEAEFLKFKGVQDLELDKMLSKHKKIDIGTPIIDVKDVERYILNDSPGIENLETFKIKT